MKTKAPSKAHEARESVAHEKAENRGLPPVKGKESAAREAREEKNARSAPSKSCKK